MRILVASDQWSPDVVGGSARVAADAARALARRGHEIVVLTVADPRHAEVDHDGGVEVRRHLRRGPFPQTLADPALSFRHARALRSRSFDVALAHQPTNAVGLAAALDCPLALVFHASAVLEARFLRGRLKGRRRLGLLALDPIFVALERRVVSEAASILVLSQFSRDILLDRHPEARDRTHVVGGAVGDEFFAEPSDPAACRDRLGIPVGRLLFTARRLDPRMGIDVLIDAIASIDDDLVLAVAGSGASHDHLVERVRMRGLQSRVRFLGAVSEDDLRSLYAAADLFILPTVAYEGFGMSTVEALAAGTPTLGTSVGATPEIVGALGPEFVVPEADAEALAASIRRVLPLLGPELRARARGLAELHYRWDSTIPRWENAIEAAIRR